jgi:hypothetical protein
MPAYSQSTTRSRVPSSRKFAFRDRRPVVERPEHCGHPREQLGLGHPLRGRRRTLDEACHEPALRLDERDDVRSDPCRSGRPRRGELDAAVDAEQARVLPGDTQDVELTVDLEISTLRLWFVMPPPRTSALALWPGQTRSTASSRALMP